MGLYYRPSSHYNDADKLFFEELKDTSKSTYLVFMGDFNLPETAWPRRFLKNLDDNFIEQVLREQTRKDALLDLLVNIEDLLDQSGQ
ncbi:hypothetical protein TURU_018890 [Turdus rufiventris]|nr:hypothetical protein TURU_018890 [Turdus rufiventris]